MIERIQNRDVTVGVIGLGYVGLPLALAFLEGGFRVVGIDVDVSKVDKLKKGKTYIQDVPEDSMRKFVHLGKGNGRKDGPFFRPTTDFSALRKIDAVSICVPTPLSKTKDPDLSFILEATKKIKQYLHRGQIIILESTTYPGTTRELILPELESTGLKVGKDFYLAFSPERIDPGNKNFTITSTPKVVGGITKKCSQIVTLLYSQVINHVVEVSSADTAEMVKLLENTFRSVNIALVNEMAIMCNILGVDVWEVIEASGTKPYGFMKFYPGPGLGGHCIPIDPHYLSWKLKILNYKARFIELASEINTRMPHLVVEKITEGFNRQGKSVKGTRILIVGVAYKKDIDDVRESPALDVIRILQAMGAKVSFHDPYVLSLKTDQMRMESIKLTKKALSAADCTVIITDHSCFDPQFIVTHSNLTVDSRNITKGVRSPKLLRL